MKLIAFAKSLWERPSEKPNADVPFLQLPAKVIHLIAKSLTPADIALLSQTCRSMRESLNKYPNAAALSRADYFAYLAGMARGLPNQWLCDYCMALHPIDKRDKPTTKWRPCSCPNYSVLASHRRCRLQNPNIPFEHHHIQLALKYTRLGQRKYDSYLRALLEPYQEWHFYTMGRRAIDHEAHYFAFPRIVTGGDGNPRYLLFSTCRYLGGGRDMLIQNLGCQDICPHLHFRDDGDYYQYNNNLFRAFQYALEPKYHGHEWEAACPRCATDFSVTRRGRNLYLKVWQDFGPEGSPIDLAWRSQTFRPGLDGIENGPTEGPTLYHEPGSIKKLYGPVPEIPTTQKAVIDTTT
ncbi:hypothetical protein NUW58_g7628 [Xylaria curta]|uniref:Uncharacterized protein n=1 Tax=Xylaria curta TaxID=42375 RepID=A0ACC1NI42_9PEZI|nr:hypothetical protein NUW58_g7628 [Xylaria curta]